MNRAVIIAGYSSMFYLFTNVMKYKKDDVKKERFISAWFHNLQPTFPWLHNYRLVFRHGIMVLDPTVARELDESRREKTG